MLKKILTTVFASMIALASTPAMAWDGVTTGKIGAIEVVTDGQNFGFRVYTDGKPMCGTAMTWAYINRNENNYDAMVSLLTASYLSGKTVILYTNAVGSFCALGHAAFL